MNGFEIFSTSVRRVLSDLENALRISALPYGLYAIVFAYFEVRFGPYEALLASTPPDQMPPAPPSGYFMSMLLSLAVTIIVLNWLAVAWHRYVLEGELPDGWVTPWHGARNLAYLGNSVLLAILVVGLVTVVTLPLALVLLFLAPAVAVVVAVIVSLRFGAALPAAAIGKPIGFGGAWKATKGANGKLLALGLVAAVFTVIISVPQIIGATPGSALTIVYDIVVGWFATMFSVSVLTTIYAIYVDRQDPR